MLFRSKIIIKYIFSEELTKDILLQKYRLLNEDEIKKIVNRIIDGTFDKEKIKKNVRDIKHDLSSTLLNNLRDQSALHSTIIEFIVSCNKCIFKRKDFEFKDIFCLNDKCVNFENLEEIFLANKYQVCCYTPEILGLDEWQQEDQGF